MPRLRRFAALLVLPLVLQLALAAKAVACVRVDVGARADAVSAEMAGMDMSRGPMSHGDSYPDSRHPSPCDNSSGPACQPLAPCGSPVMAADTGDLITVAPPTSSALPLVVLAPASRLRAPDPPPPRI